ncbi:MAG: ABC transporter ATP-binding protein, partial [Clostridiales bacterium]
MIFSVVNGSFSYQIKAKPLQFLLRDLNFSLKKGQLMAVLGPNGAGKTTLLRCMMGLLHWQKGMTLLDGENLKNFRHDQLWRKIAYVPQAKSSVGMFTVFDMVLLGRSSHFGMLQQPGAEDRRIAAEALAMLHISTLAKRNCGQISGGELQMVLIARALAAQPELLVLDEPESNLDFKNQLIVLDAMTELTQQGISCIFNTHYPAHAMQRADQSLLLDKQGNYLFGATADIITEDNIEAAFGVKTVIGEIETEHRIYRDILPVSVLRMDFEKQHNRGADIAHRDSSESKEGNVMA